MSESGKLILFLLVLLIFECMGLAVMAKAALEFWP
jgi:hypothetical protein